jgi:hypothetical protein
MDLDHALVHTFLQRNVQLGGPNPGFHAGQAYCFLRWVT